MVELMIGMAISLLLVLGVTVLFLQQTKSYATQDEHSQVVENAALLVQVVGHDAQHAGYLGPLATDTLNTFGSALIVSGVDGAGTNSSDEVTFRYFGSVDSSMAVDGTVVDCLGFQPASASTMIVDRFYVAPDPANNNEPSLFCSNGTTSAVLVAGVESLQILYGEDVNGSGAISRYAPAGSVNMAQVKGLMIAAVLRSPSSKHLNMVETTFNHFGGTYAPGDAAPAGDSGSVFAAPTDTRIRKMVRFTVGLRNRLN